MISEILGLVVNSLTADNKYAFRNSDTFLQPIQMQLSMKQKKFSQFLLYFRNLHQVSNTFSQFFAAFLKFTSNFEHFEKQDDVHSLCIFQVTDCERRG